MKRTTKQVLNDLRLTYNRWSQADKTKFVMSAVAVAQSQSSSTPRPTHYGIDKK